MRMTDSPKGHPTILAAGGIVFREGSRRRIAIVRLRRDKSWVLPKGKLYAGEPAVAAAKREVMEETGHEVSVHGFLGTMSYPVGGKIKIVQFWHMQAVGEPVHELASEIKAVKWLPLKQAIATLSRVREKVFLANVGPAALKAIERPVRDRRIKSVLHYQDRRGSRRSFVAPVGQSLAAGA
jgi:8-oxo-dGTP diphosphatase